MFVNLLMPMVCGHWFWVCGLVLLMGFWVLLVVGGFGLVGFVNVVALLVVSGRRVCGFYWWSMVGGRWLLLSRWALAL